MYAFTSILFHVWGWKSHFLRYNKVERTPDYFKETNALATHAR